MMGGIVRDPNDPRPKFQVVGSRLVRMCTKFEVNLADLDAIKDAIKSVDPRFDDVSLMNSLMQSAINNEEPKEWETDGPGAISWDVWDADGSKVIDSGIELDEPEDD